jgi:NADH dehydrogenase/NADH:ubiquinone oxidoreductase subunit G
MIKLIVDGREIEAEAGENLLETCLEHGIYIPNLCFLKEMTNPPASCRLCFVEVAGESKPVPACKVTIKGGMAVRTDTEPVRRLQRAAFRLLRSVHRLDCRNCPVNKKCELQRLARVLRVPLKPKRLDHIVREAALSDEHPLFVYDPSKCVLCGRCVYVCRKRHGYGLLTFARRGFNTVISSFGEQGNHDLPCNECRACVDICPVAAIFLRENRT